MRSLKVFNLTLFLIPRNRGCETHLHFSPYSLYLWTVPQFLMGTLAMAIVLVHSEEWWASIDLKDSSPISSNSFSVVSFSYSESVLPVAGLSTLPVVFTKGN